MIERTHLTILRQIKRDGSLTAAARSLHLTQSALSHTIKKLENQTGIQIWTREGRRIRLTPAGDYLLSTASRLLPQLERADEVIGNFASGAQGELRIGMECHPCYQWLLRLVEPYLKQWPGVDIDVLQQFQFGGMAALFNHDIDILVTPDPLRKKGVFFAPVFDYEQVLAVCRGHRLAQKNHVSASDLSSEILLSYPVDPSRLDIFTQLLVPARRSPKKHKSIESTDIMLQLVATGRGVAALPKWLIEEYAQKLPIVPVQLGRTGIPKQIHLGVRVSDCGNRHIDAFMQMAQKRS